MLKRLVLCLPLLVMVATAPLSAQARGEVGIFAGWSFNDGIEGDPFIAGDGNIYDRVDPKDAFAWGLDLGVLLGEGGEVGFLYGRQSTKLEVGGTSTREIGDQSVSTYHGYFGYNFGPSDSAVRPYILGGFGATNYGEVQFTTVAGVNRTIDSITKFSSTWGGGVKFYPSPNVGVRFGLRWTPAYIRSDAEGWWCDPYWGCYLVGDPQYATLFDFNGGVTFRF